MENKKNAPNAVASLILGISSLVFGCFAVGLILGIIGSILAKRGLNVYDKSPELYKGDGMLKAGRVTSIIGIIFGALSLVYLLVVVIIIGESFFWFY